MVKKLLTVSEVAECLQLTEDATYRLIREGILPAVRLGRQVRVDPDTLEVWISNGGQAKKED